MTLDEIKQASPFAIGGENVNYAQYFDGKSYLNGLSLQQVYVGNVTFEPGCRNHWHIHHAESGGGQILLVTAGRGWYQEWENRQENSRPAMSSTSRRKSSTGTAQPKTVRSSIWPSRYRARRQATNGASP